MLSPERKVLRGEPEVLPLPRAIPGFHIMNVGRDQTHSVAKRPPRPSLVRWVAALGIGTGIFLVLQPGFAMRSAKQPSPQFTLDGTGLAVSKASPPGPVYGPERMIGPGLPPDFDPLHIRRGVLGEDDFMFEVLVDGGATQLEADRTVRALRDHFDFRNARPGHRFEAEITESGKVQRLAYRVSAAERYEARLDETGTLRGRQVDVPVEKRLVEIEGRIEHSLYEAFVSAGESPTLAMSLADAFRFDVDFFHDTRKGDLFRLIVEKHSVEGERVAYGPVLAAEYRGTAGGPVGTKRLFRHQTPGASSAYYDQNGKAAERAFLRSPLKFTRVSSGFGYRRHPILKKRHFHGGVDYAAPLGTPVHSVGAGRVTFAGRKGANGKMVKIRHTDGYESYYLHLSSILVKVGAQVSQSTVIGRVGSTGRSTGPHLDFRLRRHGKYLNPRQLVAPRTHSIPASERAQFLTAIAPLAARLDGMKQES